MTFQEILTTPNSMFRIGEEEILDFKADTGREFHFKIYPSTIFVNEDGNLFDDDTQFICYIDQNGYVQMEHGSLKNSDGIEFMRQENIKNIKVQENLILFIKEDNTPIKAYYFAPQNGTVVEANTHNPVTWITRIHGYL